MRLPISIAVAAVAASPLPPLAGQHLGTVEVGAIGRFTRFDRSLQLDNAFGEGGHLGVFFAPSFAFEVAAVYNRTTGPVSRNEVLIPLYAQLVYGAPIGDDVALLLGAGYVHSMHDRTGNVWDDGGSGLIGVRFGLDQTLTLRLEAIADFIPSPANHSVSIPNNWNFALQAGLSAWLGGSRLKDSDHDGVVDPLDGCRHTPPGDAVDARGCSLPKDADQDNVVDALDRCPNTPARETVDATGCPLPKDQDMDRVGDSLDRCPNTPRGEPVDAAGCPLDSDHDGVLDSVDKCPNTPGRVDTMGCPPSPSNDSDGDGLVDSADKCPGTPVGERVDAIGCPALFLGSQRILVLEAVRFDPGSTTLTAPARGELDRVAVSLVAHPGLRVEVAGHSDNLGTNAAKLGLSWARADAVRRYLIGRGIPREQVTARGFGGDQPIDTNATEQGRARNRRVELRRLN